MSGCEPLSVPVAPESLGAVLLQLRSRGSRRAGDPMSRILRYEVPVDDQPHGLELSGSIVHVDSRNPEVVELWAFETGWPPRLRTFQVVGTGHPFPDGWLHVGSVIVAGGALVWHLLEVTP